MEMNPNEYDTHIPWTPPQNHIQNLRYRNTPIVARAGRPQRSLQQQQGPALKGTGQKPKQAERMPKARTLALAQTLKRWLVVASIVSFGTFSGLAAFHQVGTTTTAQAKQASSKTSQTTSTTNTTSSSNNGFLKQKGGNNLGTSSSSQGTTSGSSTTSSAPVTGSSTS